MDVKSSFETKLKVLNSEDGVLLVAGRKREVVILYFPKNFGGTYYRTEYKVGCLIGMKWRMTAVILNEGATLDPIFVRTPAKVDIKNCITLNKLMVLPTHPLNLPEGKA